MLCTAERALRSRLYRISLYRRQAMAVPLDCSGLGVVRCSRTGRPRLTGVRHRHATSISTNSNRARSLRDRGSQAGPRAIGRPHSDVDFTGEI